MKVVKIIKLTLIKIGIRCDLDGFEYLRKAIEFVIESPDLIKNVCTNLYPMVAKCFENTTASRVERSIRHAIAVTAEEHSFGYLNEMFKTLIYGIDEKPTARELIRLIAEYYLMGLYKDDFKNINLD